MPDTTTIPVNVILASNSPRRKQLLEEAGVKFTVYTGSTEVDESLDADQRSQPSEAVKKLAERKAGSVIQDIRKRTSLLRIKPSKLFHLFSRNADTN